MFVKYQIKLINKKVKNMINNNIQIHYFIK